MTGLRTVAAARGYRRSQHSAAKVSTLGCQGLLEALTFNVVAGLDVFAAVGSLRRFVVDLLLHV